MVCVSAMVTFDQSVQWIHLNIFHIVIPASLRTLLLLTVVEVLLTIMRANCCTVPVIFQLTFLSVKTATFLIPIFNKSFSRDLLICDLYVV